MKKDNTKKLFGAYYTPLEITSYLCKHTIHSFILQKINATAASDSTRGGRFSSMEELLANLDARLCRELLAILPTVSILDPACGPGAFLIAALDTLSGIYEAITSSMATMCDPYLAHWLEQAHIERDNLTCSIKKKIIGENLFGVDIMEEAVVMAKLHLYHALVSSMQDADEVEPLTAIDFNIRTGNALIGLLHLGEDATQRHPSFLNRILFDEFNRLGVKYEQSTWDCEKQSHGKSVQRALTIEDIEALRPFHWGYEFPHVMNERGGFDHEMLSEIGARKDESGASDDRCMRCAGFCERRRRTKAEPGKYRLAPEVQGSGQNLPKQSRVPHFEIEARHGVRD